MYRVPPEPIQQTMFIIEEKKIQWQKILPVIGLLQAKHFFAKSRAKQSAQNGFSSRDVNRWPANEFRQFVHVKHSRCLKKRTDRISSVRAVQVFFSFFLPWLILVCHTSLRNHLMTMSTFRGKMFFITWNTITFLISRNETFRSDWLWTWHTSETMFMKLLTTIFEFFRAWRREKYSNWLDEDNENDLPGLNIWLHLSQREANCWL